MAKQWEPYKEEILRLYMIEDLTLNQVKDRMSISHGFDRKKHQYEHRLKIWGARKNMKREEWEYISHQHRKQNRTPHNSNVYVDGVPLGRSRLTRALQRYQPDVSLARKFGRAPSPELPNGHLVRLASPRSFELSIDWPNSLPWLQFERRFTITFSPSTKLIHLLAQTAQNLGLMPAMENKTSLEFARAIYAASRGTPSGVVDLARMIHDSWRSAIPFNFSKSGGIAAQMLRMILFQVSNKLCRARHVRSRYSDGRAYLDMTGRGKHLLVLFHELHKTHPTVLDQLLTWTDPTSEAITESLYDDAVIYGHTALVSTLLRAGKDVNARLALATPQEISRFNGRLSLHFNNSLYLMTPLQWAASVCDVKLASLLIDAGAKINLGYPAPLAILCSNTKADDADVLRFTDLLVHHGARVNTSTNAYVSPLMGAVTSENKDLVRFLLQHGAEDVVERWVQSSETGLIQSLLLTKDHKLLFPGEAERTDPMSALQISMVVNNTGITDMLIQSVSNQEDGNEILEWGLVTACVAGEKDLVRRLLVHLQAHFHDKISLVNEIILATAWDMDCEIANLLLDHRAVQRELQNSSLAFFQAAALHGNTLLIKLLESKGFDVNSGAKLQFRLLDRKTRTQEWQPPSLASTPMGCAVWMEHKDAIEALLAIGADMAEIHIVNAVRSGSQNLVSQVLDRCDNVDEPWEEQRALDVAIRYHRGMALIRKLIDAGAVLHGHEIVDAVRSDDQEVVRFFLPSCNVLETNKDGENVLEAACRTGNLEMVRYYFACGGAYSSRAMMLAVSRAVKTHDYRVIASLVTGRPSRPIDDYEASCLALSIRMGDTVLANIFLDDPFRSGIALTIYCCCDELEKLSDGKGGVEDLVHPFDYDNQHIGIQVLFEDVCRQGAKCYYRLSPMLIASFMGQGQLVRAMLSRGYLPDALLVDMSYRQPAISKEIRDEVLAAYISLIPLVQDQYWHECLLVVAAQCGDIDIRTVQQHLKKLKSLYPCHKGCDIPRDTERDRHEPLNLMLEALAGARRGQPSLLGETFLLAIVSSRLDLASLLLDHGADINAHRSEALCRAIKQKDFEAVVFLLEKGIDVDVPGFEGETPLELAAAAGMIDTLQLLLTRGVDIQGRMRIHFIRAVTFAIEYCHYAAAKILKERNCWTDEDQNLAKTPRGSHHLKDYCPRFLYDDPSLEACKRCLEKSETVSSTSRDDEHIASGPTSLAAVTEQFEDHEVGPLTDNLSILDLDSEVMEDGQTAGTSDWPLVPYGPQDRELDDIVRGLLLEDGMIVDLE